MRIVNVGSFNGVQLPFRVVRVNKGENGERIIEGVKSFDSKLDHIPLTTEVNGETRALTRDERVRIAADLEIQRQRAERRSQKGNAVSLPKTKETASKVILVPATSIPEPVMTIKRGGRWVQTSESGLYGKVG